MQDYECFGHPSFWCNLLPSSWRPQNDKRKTSLPISLCRFLLTFQSLNTYLYSHDSICFESVQSHLLQLELFAFLPSFLQLPSAGLNASDLWRPCMSTERLCGINLMQPRNVTGVWWFPTVSGSFLFQDVARQLSALLSTSNLRPSFVLSKLSNAKCTRVEGERQM